MKQVEKDRKSAEVLPEHNDANFDTIKNSSEAATLGTGTDPATTSMPTTGSMFSGVGAKIGDALDNVLDAPTVAVVDKAFEVYDSRQIGSSSKGGAA